MAKTRYPTTQAVRALRAASATYEPHLYDYEDRGGTAASSRALGVDEHAVIKTLVMEDESGTAYVVLMHGDREVSTGALARHLGCKRTSPCAPNTAEKHSGYQVGGTSPFGLRTAMPILAESTIAELDTLYINGGKRGFLVQMTGAELARVLQPTWVDVAQ